MLFILLTVHFVNQKHPAVSGANVRSTLSYWDYNALLSQIC